VDSSNCCVYKRDCPHSRLAARVNVANVLVGALKRRLAGLIYIAHSSVVHFVQPAVFIQPIVQPAVFVTARHNSMQSIIQWARTYGAYVTVLKLDWS